MSLISYVKTVTNKRYSYLRVTMIRIDVHPVGENLIHTTRTLPMPVHVCHMYAFYGQSTYVVTFSKPSSTLDTPYCS
jgi:hypothetical protein